MADLDRLLAALDVRVGPFSIFDVAAERRVRDDALRGDAMFYVLSGSGRLKAGGGDVQLSADDLIILPRGLDRELMPDQDVATCLTIAGGAIEATFGGAGGLFGSLKDVLVESFADRPLRDSFRMLTDELRSPSVGTRALTECIVKQALILMMRRQSRASASVVHPLIAALKDARLGPALAAMLDRPADPLPLEELARLSGMSRSVFAERFATAFGSPPIEFLKEVRLGHAARLLATTDLPVKRIACEVGYESRSYFSRAFRNRYDLDPSDFRAAAGAA